jgi:hypothetical protein
VREGRKGGSAVSQLAAERIEERRARERRVIVIC